MYDYRTSSICFVRLVTFFIQFHKIEKEKDIRDRGLK